MRRACGQEPMMRCIIKQLKSTSSTAAFICALSIICSACASMVSKSDYPVLVSTNPSGADVVITNSAGTEVYKGPTPNTVTLPASDGYFSGETYQVRASMNGYESGYSSINSSLDGWYFANLIFGGLIGMLIVDPLTGAMFKLPDQTTVSLSPSSAREAVARPTAAVSSPADTGR
jgi:hypothetical protein